MVVQPPSDSRFVSGNGSPSAEKLARRPLLPTEETFSNLRKDLGRNDLQSVQKDVVHMMTIRGTRLEGDVFSHSMESMSSFLSDFSTKVGTIRGGMDQVASSLGEQFSSLANLSREIEKIEVSHGDKEAQLNQLCKNLEGKIGKLKSDEKLLIPGGTMAHAMLYEVSRQADGRLSFAVINTGDGLNKGDYHNRQVVNGVTKYDPACRFKGISHIHANDLKKFLRLQVQEQGSEVQRIYGFAEELGKSRGGRKEEESFTFIKPQKIGTCTHKVLRAYTKMAYLEKNPKGGLKDFKRMKVASQLSTLKNLRNFDRLDSADSVGQSSLKGGGKARLSGHESFIKLAAATFEKSYNKLQKESCLSGEEQEKVDQLLKEIKQQYPYDENSFSGMKVRVTDYVDERDGSFPMEEDGAVDFVIGAPNLLFISWSREKDVCPIYFSTGNNRADLSDVFSGASGGVWAVVKGVFKRAFPRMFQTGKRFSASVFPKKVRTAIEFARLLMQKEAWASKEKKKKELQSDK